MCLAALLCEQFCRFANGGAKISIKFYFMKSFFFSMYSAAVKCEANLVPFGVNYRLQLAGLGKKIEETVKPTCFTSKATLVPQTNHSQYSSPVEALNLIVDSKSQLVGLGNSTIELHVPSRQKKACNHILFPSFNAI